MRTRLRFKSAGIAILFLCLYLAVRPSAAQQAGASTGTPAVPAGAPAPTPKETERPKPEEVARLQNGPAMAYKLDANWPDLPNGYNFGETSGVDIDKEGNVWVFNRGHWPMFEFSRSGKMLQAWTEEQFAVKSAHGVRVGPDGNLWCVDVAGHMVFKVSPLGKILMVIGNRQGVPGTNDALDAFNQPTNVAFAANGNIYVSDGYINGRVIEFTPEGEFVRKWGTRGKGDGMFNLVHDVTVDSKGLVYVADRTNERVQVFDETGKFLAKWSDVGAPWGICYVAKENVIYMCDGKYDRITKLSLEGKVLGQFGEWGKAAGKFDYVHGLAVDASDGSIYTVEIKNWRVQKWLRE